jgi:hypothetical protein
MSPTERPDINEAAMQQSIAQIDRAVDAVYMCANAVARVILLDAPDVPRLCISAGCRTLERLLSYYQRRQAEATATQTPIPDKEKLELQQQIRAACEDALETMAEASATARRCLDALGVKTN